MMIGKHVWALFVVGATVTFASLGCQGIAQKSRSNWSAKDVTARFRATIDGQGFMPGVTEQPKSGTRILEISGTFSATSEPRSLVLEAVFLSAGSAPKTDKDRWVIETVGQKLGGSCSGPIVGQLLSGAVKVSFGDKKFVEYTSYLNGVAMKWALGKETENGPWQAKFHQNPTPLCMVFVVPENVPRNVVLHFGDAAVPVVVPATR